MDSVKAIALLLYDLLLRPVIGDDLDKGARLRLWLDGALRFLPPAALFDGSRYLVEKTPISLYSPFAGPTMPQRNLRDDGIAGFAVTREVAGFAPLPFAVSEVEAVVGENGLFRGERFLGERFTPATLTQAAGRFGGLLIATHFMLHPADLGQSGLLTGTGELMSVRQIAELDMNGLLLVTISGCDTGTAGLDDDTALLHSLADRLRLRGASAVLASLWRVADAGAARLVTDFYAGLARDGDHFAAALAQAQIAMARGDALSGLGDGGAARGIGGDVRADQNFRHPYFWAPFVLVGDGAALKFLQHNSTCRGDGILG